MKLEALKQGVRSAVGKLVKTFRSVLNAGVIVGGGVFTGFGAMFLYSYMFELNSVSAAFIGFLTGSCYSAVLAYSYQKEEHLEEKLEAEQQSSDKGLFA